MRAERKNSVPQRKIVGPEVPNALPTGHRRDEIG